MWIGDRTNNNSKRICFAACLVIGLTGLFVHAYSSSPTHVCSSKDEGCLVGTDNQIMTQGQVSPQSSAMYTWQRRKDGTFTVFTCAETIGTKESQLTFEGALQHMQDDPTFVDSLKNLVVNYDAKAVYFEVIPVTAATLSTRVFEFALSPAVRLSQSQPDPQTFEGHFETARANNNINVATFGNLGGDTTLVSPLPMKGKSYPHLVEFLKQAPTTQILATFNAFAKSAHETITKRGSGNTYLSTAGDGVTWLHLRLDPRPKYYNYAKYKTMA
eukprot:m.62048 g.62048  ORF g.62048 m.62048 type:complete len:272 (-) comp23074_c1_seq3:66-881(-)